MYRLIAFRKLIPVLYKFEPNLNQYILKVQIQHFSKLSFTVVLFGFFKDQPVKGWPEFISKYIRKTSWNYCVLFLKQSQICIKYPFLNKISIFCFFTNQLFSFSRCFWGISLLSNILRHVKTCTNMPLERIDHFHLLWTTSSAEIERT